MPRPFARFASILLSLSALRCGSPGVEQVGPGGPSDPSCSAGVVDEASAVLVASPSVGFSAGIVVEAAAPRALVGTDASMGDAFVGFTTVDLATGKTVAFANELFFEPVGIALDPETNEVFLGSSDRVLVLDANGDGTVLATIVLPTSCVEASAIALDAGSHRLFVLGRHGEWGPYTNAITEIDTHARTVTRTIDTGLSFRWDDPLQPSLAFDPATDRLHVLGRDTATQGVVVESYDASGLTLSDRTSVAGDTAFLAVDQAGVPLVATSGPPATIAVVGDEPRALPSGFTVAQIVAAGAGRAWVVGQTGDAQPAALLYLRCGSPWNLASIRTLPAWPDQSLNTNAQDAAVRIGDGSEDLLLGFGFTADVLQEVRLGPAPAM